MGRHAESRRTHSSPSLQGPTERHYPQQRKPTPSSSFGIKPKLVWDQANRQSVALKTLRTDPCSQPVEYETKSMDRVSPHRNIVRLIKVVARSPSNVCLVMEAAAASRDDLMETIAAAPEGRLRPETARFYLGQLLDAVQHCHSRGVCHRDIQPHNLLVDQRSGNMKLSGFGRAGLWDATVGDATDLAYAPSTVLLPHSAPEVLEGSRYCGKAADCWSVGSTLFTMLAGFSPSSTDDLSTVDEAKVGNYDRSFQYPPWMGPLVCSLLKGMMEPDAEKRYTIAEIRSHPWFALKRRASESYLERGARYSSSSSSNYSSNYSSSSSYSSSVSTSDTKEGSARSESSSDGSFHD